MRSLLGLVLVLFIVVGQGIAAPVPKADPKNKDLPVPELIRRMLDAKTNLEFSGVTLPGVIGQLSEDHRINFVLDKAVIQQMGFEPNEIQVDFKLKDTKLRTGLRTLLGQYNLTFVVIGETVLITTEEQAIYKQLKQRISVDHESVPLSKAVKDLAQSSGINVVIDPRVLKSKEADAPITLNVDDVPFEAVVRLMCEMANLKPARMGNVIFITTPERAERLKDSESLVPTPTGPGGVVGGGLFVPPNPGAVTPQVIPAVAPPAP